MNINITKQEQKDLGDNLKELVADLENLTKKYEFESGGYGNNLLNGSFDLFYYKK